MGWVLTFPEPEDVPGDEPAAIEATEPARISSPLSAADARMFLAEAFQQLQRDVYSFSLHLARDAEVAADVTQDVFLRLLSEAERRGPPEHLKGWLLRVATNIIISRGRRISVADRFSQRFGRHREPHASPEVDVLQREHSESIRAMLGHIQPDARAALLLAAEGYSGREIAAMIGRTELATRVLMSRARTRLRALLDGGEADLGEGSLPDA